MKRNRQQVTGNTRHETGDAFFDLCDYDTRDSKETSHTQGNQAQLQTATYKGKIMLTNDTTEIAMRLYENKAYGKTNGPGLYKKALFNGTIDVKDPCVKFVIDFYSYDDWCNSAKTDMQMQVLAQVTPEPQKLYSWVTRYDTLTKQKTLVMGVCTIDTDALAVTATIIDTDSCIEDAWSMQARACKSTGTYNSPQLLATNSDLGSWK